MADSTLQMYPLVDPETGKHFYPQTHAKAVLFSDGTNAEDRINGYEGFANASLSGNGYVLDIDFTFNEGKRIAVKFTAAPTVTEPYIVIGGTNYPIKKKNGNAAKITAGTYESLICGTDSFILLGEGGEYGSATPTDVLAGKTLGTENGLVEGTIPIITGDSVDATGLNVQSNYVYLGITPDAYYSGVNWVRKSEPNLIAANIKAGASIFGVAGNSNVVDTSTGNATAAQMLDGSKAFVAGELVEGTMANNGAVSATLVAGESHTIAAGYHNGTGKITAAALSGQTPGTATAEHILKDKTAWVGGVELTGTMANNGAVSATLAANGTYTIPAGYHDGTGKVSQSLTTKAAATITPGTTDQTIAAGTYLSGAQTIAGDTDLVAANIKQDVGIFGVTGTYTSDGTLAANRVLSGYIGYSKGTKYTGSIASKAATTITPGTTNQTISSGVYLSGNITILGSSSLVSSNIKSGVTIFGVSGTMSSIECIGDLSTLNTKTYTGTNLSNICTDTVSTSNNYTGIWSTQEPWAYGNFMYTKASFNSSTINLNLFSISVTVVVYNSDDGWTSHDYTSTIQIYTGYGFAFYRLGYLSTSSNDDFVLTGTTVSGNYVRKPTGMSSTNNTAGSEEKTCITSITLGWLT